MPDICLQSKIFLNSRLVLAGSLLSRASIRELLLALCETLIPDILRLPLPPVAAILWLYLSPSVEFPEASTGSKIWGPLSNK